MDGLGEWVQLIFDKAGDVYAQMQEARYQALAAQANVDAEVAKANSKKWLYLGIGVIGAAFMLSLVRKAAKG